MKKILVIVASIVMIAGCKMADKKASSNDTSTSQPGSNKDSASRTSIVWLDTQELNMGKMNEGEKLEVKFRFKNTGNQPLVISRVWAQCGCTVPETPKEPFAPGQEGIIKAIFDSHGRGGTSNTKEVYVNANTDPITNVLVFKVDVTKKEN